MVGRRGLAVPRGVIALAAIAAASLGALTELASADHFHTNCVPHGFVHGTSTGDGSFHARVEGGCGNPGKKTCTLYIYNAPYGSSEEVGAGDSTTCNAWSYAGGRECAATARVDFDSVFESHPHNAHNWCL